MSNQSSGHYRNVANFQKLIAACAGFGARYNPSRAAISIENLELLAQQAETALTNANVATLTHRDKLNQRRAAFAELSALCSRVINALAASGIPAKSIQDARVMHRKIQGYRQQPTEAKAAEGIESAATKHSTSQMSFDARLENFEKLVEMLKLHPEYQPNEPDLKVPQLEAFAINLATFNLAANASTIAEYNTRLSRNAALYGPDTGIFDISHVVKSYVRSIFGSSSPQLKKVTDIRFSTYYE